MSKESALKHFHIHLLTRLPLFSSKVYYTLLPLFGILLFVLINVKSDRMEIMYIQLYIYTCNYSEALFFPLSHTFHALCLYNISNNSFVRDIKYSCLVILMKLMKGQLLYSTDEIANSSNLTKKV